MSHPVRAICDRYPKLERVSMRRAILWSLLSLSALPGPSRAETVFGAVRRESGVVDVRGVPHPFMIEGEGEPCLVVGPGTQYPQLLSDRLKRSIRFIFVAFKQTWDAPAGTDFSAVTLQSLVDEIDAVRQAFGLEKICLVGHSTAGLLAIEYALQRPDHTSRVILIGAPAYANAEAERRRKAFWEEDASPQRKAKYAENLRRIPNELLRTLSSYDNFMLLYTRGGPYYFYDYDHDSTWTRFGHYFSTELAIRFYRETMANYDPRPRLANNKIPIFSAVGRYDYITPMFLWEGFEKQVPLSTVVIFNRSGHFPMVEEQDRFDSAVEDWLKTGNRARSANR